MNQQIALGGHEYEISSMSHECKELVEKLTFINVKLQELQNSAALLSKAKNGYIEDLKTEIIQERTGVDFSDIFSDD